MVTSWRLHWDQLQNKWGNSTFFTLPIIKDGLANGPWPTEANTLFIKRAEDGKFEKCWIGKTKNFRIDPNNGKTAVRFEVADLMEVECPSQFLSYTNGWHLNKAAISTPIQPTRKTENTQSRNLIPPFFTQMATCDPLTFELYCFHLLRLLGIHDIHKIPQENNRGKADGFFRFQTLSVIYDATLETDYLKKKETQIENYLNQLKKEKLDYESISYTIKDTQKQVWIITRGKAVVPIRKADHIKVKEIPYTKLIEVYYKRMTTEIGMDDLLDILNDLK